MPGFPVDDGCDSSPTKKVGSARTSKKSRKRNVVRYLDWSAEQDSVDSSPTGVQQKDQDVEAGNGSGNGVSGETITPEVPANSPGSNPSLDHELRDVSPDNCATAPGVLSPSGNEDEDAPPPDPHSATKSERMEQDHEFQRVQEEQEADDWPSENIRPTAQNLRFGGYPTQPAPQNRNTPLGSARLQNTSKLGAAQVLPSRLVRWTADAF